MPFITNKQFFWYAEKILFKQHHPLNGQIIRLGEHQQNTINLFACPSYYMIHGRCILDTWWSVVYLMLKWPQEAGPVTTYVFLRQDLDPERRWITRLLEGVEELGLFSVCLTPSSYPLCSAALSCKLSRSTALAVALVVCPASRIGAWGQRTSVCLQMH